MRKNKLFFLLLVLSIIIASPAKVYATEVETSQEEIADESSTQIDEIIENTESTEIAETPDASIESSNTTETVSEQTNTEISASYGWLKITSEMLTNNIESELILEFQFTNTETKEIITKQLSSNDNFENVVKLPLGTYDVKLLTEGYEENVIYEKQININSKEVEYKISINNINMEKEEVIEEESSTILDLFKNNLLFIVLLVGCGGFLLYREIKKNQ